MRKLSVTELDLADRRVLVRVDFNFPIENGRVGDDSRLRATLPTLRLLHQRGARSVLCSHLGRPHGKPDARYSLRPVCDSLNACLRQQGLGEAVFSPQTVGAEVESKAAVLGRGGFLLLENLRFDPREERNDPDFSRQLARLGDVYVDDAFGSAHRAHASIEGVTKFFERRAAGLLMQSELEHLGKLLTASGHPYVVVMGGAKVSDKLPVLRSLGRHADLILIGGAMAYTFLAARGEAIGSSRFEPELVEAARELIRDRQPGMAEIRLPVDHVVSSGPDDAAGAREVARIPDGACGLDIGPRTRREYAAAIMAAAELFWNGPMGVFEKPPFNAGTLAIAQAAAACPGMTVAGGGDSVAALRQADLADRLTFVSTGGGASLEFLAGDTLPGVAALSDVTD